MVITIDGKRWLKMEGKLAYLPPRVNVCLTKGRLRFSYTGITKRHRKEVFIGIRPIMEAYEDFLDKLIDLGELYDHPFKASYLATNPTFGKPSLVRLHGDRVHFQYPETGSGTSIYKGSIRYPGLLERMQLESDKILDEIRATKVTSTKGFFKYANAKSIAA